jgi:hypothetical protein
VKVVAIVTSVTTTMIINFNSNSENSISSNFISNSESNISNNFSSNSSDSIIYIYIYMNVVAKELFEEQNTKVTVMLHKLVLASLG